MNGTDKTAIVNKYVKAYYMGLITGAELSAVILEILLDDKNTAEAIERARKNWLAHRMTSKDYREIIERYWS